MFHFLLGHEKPDLFNKERPKEGCAEVNPDGVNVFFLDTPEFIKGGSKEDNQAVELQNGVLANIDNDDDGFSYLYVMANLYFKGEPKFALMFVVGFNPELVNTDKNFWKFSMQASESHKEFVKTNNDAIFNRLIHEFNYLKLEHKKVVFVDLPKWKTITNVLGDYNV